MTSENEEPEISEDDVEGASRPVGQMYVRIPESMVNQILRNGFLPEKKSTDSAYSTGVRGSVAYHRDTRTRTTDGSLIIHSGDPDPCPGTCDAFIHPPYASTQPYRGEDDGEYHAGILLSELGLGAAKCGFCFILYNGVLAQRELWIAEWAKQQWVSQHPDLEEDEKAQAVTRKPWKEEFKDEIEEEKEIDEASIRLDISFPKDGECLSVCLVFWGPSEEDSEADDSEGDFSEGTSSDSLILPRTDSERLKNPGFREPGRTIAELEFYTSPNCPNPWAAFTPAPHIHPDIYSPSCMREISSWIEECVSSHPACVENAWNTKLAADNGLPRRILRLRDCHQDPPLVRLEDTSDSQEYKYIALSHVWAYTEPYKTTQENSPEHKDRVPWQNLSRPLQQAVALALTLGYEFLWIDSLCIIQDDPSDKERELPRMSLIYGQAAVVFAAHGWDLGTEKVGLLAIEDKYHEGDALVYCRLKMDHSNLFSASKDPVSWLGRAWCMQERIFAARILHFGGSTEELFFECNTLIRCECGGLNRDRSQRQRTLKKKITETLAKVGKGGEEEEEREQIELWIELWKVYITACENYTPRGVSFPTDSLSAVSSLMHRFMPHLGKYYAGLWEYNLLINLQWEVSDTGLCRRHEGYVAPSFSWASRSGGVVWYMDMTNLPTPATHEFATVVDISCELAGSDACGKVKSGYITLRGYTTEMKIESKSQWFPDGKLEMCREGFESCFVTLDSKEDLDRVDIGMVVKCLDVMRDKEGYHGNYVSGLILLPVDGHDGRYNRIGFSTMQEKHFEDSVLEDVVIL
ncbi:HET-domain-containing protein [Stipitochalara longipes BDJ]|nr:HET-domain-containing protein [Stipitochalara longipes BDJ]